MGIGILGGTGFLGRHLCELLQNQGHRAFVVSRNPDFGFLNSYAPSISGYQLGSPEATEALSNCKTLIFLASSAIPGTTWNDPSAILIGSVVPEVQMLQSFVALNPHARIIFTSSGGQIYGDGHSTPISEDAPLRPRTAYAYGKQVVEAALNFISLNFGNPVTILRLANPVGRWQFGGKHGFVSVAISAALTKKPLIVFGNGGNQRDYFDADDLSILMTRIAVSENNYKGVYNIGSGVGVTEMEIIELVSHEFRTNIEVVFKNRRPFDLNYAVPDPALAQNELSWKPKTTLRQSVMKMKSSLNYI